MEIKGATDTVLLMGIAGGEEPAFRELYMRYAPKVYRMAEKYLATPYLAQDAVQDIFTRVWQKRAELPEILNFDAWLTTVTRNHLINQLQKAIPARLTDEMEHTFQSPDPTGQKAEYRELETIIEDAVRNLAPKQQQVYRLKEMGYSHREIADQLNISYNTTREHMSQALRNIRGYLERHYKEALPALYLLLIRTLL